MHKYRKRPLFAQKIWPIILLAILITGSVRAQAPCAALADDEGSDASGAALVRGSRALLAPSTLNIVPAILLSDLDEKVSREFYKAWFNSGDGTTGREGVVLLFRMFDGSLGAKLQPFTNQYKQCTFRWNPAAIAIVHTHPNNSDPKPADQDKRVADKYGVPNFTITISGMYVYDPATKKTSKLMNGLDWLKLPNTQMTSTGGSRHREPSSGS
jgi:hypothetical protein